MNKNTFYFARDAPGFFHANNSPSNYQSNNIRKDISE